MSKPNLKLLYPFGSAEPFKQLLEDIVDVIGKKCDNEEDFINAIRDFDVSFADVDLAVTKNVIQAGNKLKAIVCLSKGVDFVDLKAATEKGVFVTNVPDYSVVAVAEHALGLMLAISRKIPMANSAAISGNWNKRGEFKGVELEGKTLGIIGIGQIGRCLASKAKGIGMNVIAYHPQPHTKESVARELGIIITGDIGALLKDSDFVSINVPLKDSTSRMIGERELRLMKKSAFLINCSRGAVVDERALTKALEQRWIAGAALDVLEKEPPDANNPILKLDNVIITPHIAWNTIEADEKLRRVIREQVISIVKGEIPKNLVNTEVLQRRK
ncbi:MAG: NAD(P)-dependent oxidoreductase, partial [Candidatus Bathyarchaeia archaeon]